MTHQEWFCTKARGRGDFIAPWRCRHEDAGCGLRDFGPEDMQRIDDDYEEARDAVAGDLLALADPPAGTIIPGIGEV